MVRNAGSSHGARRRKRPDPVFISRGGGNIAQQYLAAGLLDDLEPHVIPVLLGDGARLFDNLGNAEVQLEQVRAVEAPGVTHLKYRVVT
jgi:dihydrofolate reductase